MKGDNIFFNRRSIIGGIGHSHKLTLRACIATWGTLWLTRFIMDFMLSFGLKGSNTAQRNSILVHGQLPNKTSGYADWLEDLWLLIESVKILPIRGCSNLVTDVHDESPVICCVSFICCFLWKKIKINHQAQGNGIKVSTRSNFNWRNSDVHKFWQILFSNKVYYAILNRKNWL